MNLIRELFDTPAERREFVRHVFVGVASALVAVWIAKRTKVI